MSQNDVLNWFKKRSACKENDWVTFAEIYRGMKNDGYKVNRFNLNNQVRKLSNTNFLDRRDTNSINFRVAFRFKE